MKNLNSFITLFLFIGLNISYAQLNKNELIITPEDKQIAEEKLKLFSAESDLPISELITKIGLSFLETPYIVASLENGLGEKMVIDLRELDCTTFVENCLALARTVKLGKTDFESFVAELEKIRYRDGIRNKYPSRLHYFSEWISNNHQKGLISEMPNMNGIKSDKTINYMSTHPEQYPVLKEHPELVPSIAIQEKALTAKGFQYFPKENIPNLYKHLQHGDIIALTSSIEGVDINHVGIILKKGKEFYLLHAPLSGKKVLVSDGPITDFLKPASKNNGIMIARPVFRN
ncbi:MAG TPA: DUF1460 domain-containing protein [Prolixibacteraceae bacterium]|nr:DUF1460 domain-containing protein [Prolixibacteraceae bacterium]